MGTHAQAAAVLLRAQLEAYLELDRRLTAQGFSACPSPGSPARPRPGDLDAPGDPVELAAAVRRAHGLPVAPVKDLFELAFVTLGVDVLSVDLSGVDATEAAYAVSTREQVSGRSVVAVTTSRRPMLLRLAVAQQLGHLLGAAPDGTRDASPPSEEAASFARHLLLPLAAVTERHGHAVAVGLRELSDLVQAFEVPPEVAARQLREAGLVDEATCAAWCELDAIHLATRFGWRTQFGLLVDEASTRRGPQGLVARAVEAYLATSLRLDELARWAGADPADLARDLARDPGLTPRDPGAAPAAPAPAVRRTEPTAALHLGAYVPTPASVELAAHLAAHDLAAAASVLDDHVLEIWYAVDPTDLRSLLERLPVGLLGQMANAHHLCRLLGHGTGPRPPRSAGPVGMEEVAQVIADLRLSGRPAAAMAHVTTLTEAVRSLRGQIVGSSGGRVELWLVQGAITALLAGDLATARGALLAATHVHRPDRFPFVHREASAKLALVQVLVSGPTEAAEWITRARQLPATESWVEVLVDDTLWLAEYLCAIDTLDLEVAEQMRLARPSPLDHLEFWGVALQAHVRHLLLTGRGQQARALCDSVADLGLPLPGSDGWVARMLDEARLTTALDGGRIGSPGSPESRTALGVLAHRVALLSSGQFHAGTHRHPYEVDGAQDPRVRLSLRLLRAQSLVGAGRAAEGSGMLDAALAEVATSGLHSELRHLTAETLASLATTTTGARLAELVERHGLTGVTVVPMLRAPLTAAEIRVLELLSAGLSRQLIADTLVVSLSTVKSHLRTAYQKLGVRDRREAVTRCERLGLLADRQVG